MKHSVYVKNVKRRLLLFHWYILFINKLCFSCLSVHNYPINIKAGLSPKFWGNSHDPLKMFNDAQNYNNLPPNIFFKIWKSTKNVYESANFFVIFYIVRRDRATIKSWYIYIFNSNIFSLMKQLLFTML